MRFKYGLANNALSKAMYKAKVINFVIAIPSKYCKEINLFLFVRIADRKSFNCLLF